MWRGLAFVFLFLARNGYGALLLAYMEGREVVEDDLVNPTFGESILKDIAKLDKGTHVWKLKSLP
jgi:hypothetical protein